MEKCWRIESFSGPISATFPSISWHMKFYGYIPFALVLGFCVTSCVRVPHAKENMNSPEMAEITVFGRSKMNITNPKQIIRLRAWLDSVSPTQPPIQSIGAVGPWCTVTFFSGSEGRAHSTNDIYSISDRVTRHELITTEQRQELLDILDKKPE
jgi:hypothetical protein